MSMYTDKNDEFVLSLKASLPYIDISEHITQKIVAVNKGVPMSLEQRKKISLIQTGRPLSESHKKSISKAKTGLARNEETRKKISDTVKGKPRKPLSDSHRANLRLAWEKRKSKQV